MFVKNKKKGSRAKLKQQFSVIICGVAFVALGLFLFYFLFSGIFSHLEDKDNATKIEKPLSAAYLSSDNPEICAYDLFPQCLNLKTDTDFMYQQEPEPEIVEAEKPMVMDNNEQSLASRIFYQKLAEIEERDKILALISEKEEGDITESLPSETLDKIYEEELPNDVIVEDKEEDIISPEQLAEGYHINRQHKNIKKMNVIPNYKPAYFGKKPVIAIVVDDMGISQKRTHDIISLNAPLTASFLTYGKALNHQIEEAKAAGMEIMVHTPMEPHSNADIAPDVLTTQMSPDEIKNGLVVMLDKFQDIKGINNHMGSKLTEDNERMNAVMEVLKERSLFFLDSKTSAFSVAKKAAKQNGVAYATRHVFLDNENKVDYIIGQLAIAERIAHRNGYAVAICHPKSGTYQALKQWLPTLESKKIRLVHMSKIVDVLRKSRI